MCYITYKSDTARAARAGQGEPMSKVVNMFESNPTRAARAAQGCTNDSVRMGAGTLCERRSGEEQTYRNN